MNTNLQILEEEGSRVSISSFLIHFLSPPPKREMERAPICLLHPRWSSLPMQNWEAHILPRVILSGQGWDFYPWTRVSRWVSWYAVDFWELPQMLKNNLGVRNLQINLYPVNLLGPGGQPKFISTSFPISDIRERRMLENVSTKIPGHGPLPWS